MSAIKEKLIEDMTEVAASPDPLPLSATVNDIRALVNYLKKKPQGVNVGGASDVIKRQTFDAKKVSAYEQFGIIEKSGERISLSSCGSKLSESFEAEAQLFRGLMRKIPRYREILAWAVDQKLDALVHADVASFFRHKQIKVSDTELENKIDHFVICFFQMCQGAGLGTHIIGKKGQPTRLRLDREEVLSFIKNPPTKEPAEVHRLDFRRRTMEQTAPSFFDYSAASCAAPERVTDELCVFVSAGGDQQIIKRVQSVFELAEITCRFAAPEPKEDSVMLSSAALMRQCHAAVIFVTKDDVQINRAGELVLKEAKEIEIGASYVLYDNLVTILWSATGKIPDSLSGVRLYRFAEGDLDWETCLQLAMVMKDFKYLMSDSFRQSRTLG